MIGTFVNTGTILMGSVLGSIVKKGIKEEYQGALFNAMGLAAPVLFVWQGSIYCLALLLGNFMTADMMTEISIVGGFLIASSGLSILGIKNCRTLNMLPCLPVPVVWFMIISMF